VATLAASAFAAAFSAAAFFTSAALAAAAFSAAAAFADFTLVLVAGVLAEAVVDAALPASAPVGDLFSGGRSCLGVDEVGAWFVAQAQSANDWSRHMA
jgi:hypothetical protein